MFKFIGKLFLVKPDLLFQEELAFYKELSFENFLFFKRHFEEDFEDYLGKLKNTLKSLKLLAVDQEGGRVVRIPGDYEAPLEIAEEAEKKGFSNFEAWAYKIALSIVERKLNLNLAPVVDLADEEAEDFLKHRTFGRDPIKVVALAEKFIEIHRSLGVKTCLKHFPGLREVKIDPHKDLPIKEEISLEDLLPYKKLSPKVNFIMTTHLLISKFDTYPTTFSEKLVNLLRNEILFKGVILTDDIEMGALRNYELSDRIIRAWVSGHNLIIYTGPLQNLMETLFEIKGEIEKSSVLREKITASLTIIESIH